MSLLEASDRFNLPRSPVQDAICTFQTSTSPETLTGRERYARERDLSRDIFRIRGKPKQLVKQKVTNRGDRVLVPHYTPSFVHSQGTGTNTAGYDGSQSVRYVSAGGIWSVGGRIAAVPNQLHGIETGNGDVLVSGTNAPMLSAEFIDGVTDDTKNKAHEARLAFALEIDQARRVVPISPTSSLVSEHS